MINSQCIFVKDEHKLINPRFFSWIKRQLPNVKLRESLFVYYHTIARTFVLAQWTVPCRRFVDLHNFGHNLSGTTSEILWGIVDQLRQPITSEQLRHDLKVQEWKRKVNKRNESGQAAERLLARRNKKISITIP